MASSRAVGFPRGIAITLFHLGLIALARGDAPRASALLAESMGRQQELGNKESMADCLVELAAVAGGGGQADRAARLFAAAEVLRETIGAPRSPDERARHE